MEREKMELKAIPKTLRRELCVSLQNNIVALIFAAVIILLIPWWIICYFLYFLGILFLSQVFVLFIEDWRPKPKIPTDGKAVFITGCGSGFGYSLAQRLDRQGFQVFAACHFVEKDGPQELMRSSSNRLHVIPLEVASQESVDKAVNYVKNNIGENKLWAVVNNAGLNAGGEIVWTNTDLIQHVIDVNTFGTIRITKAFLPLLINDKGRIVTVASFAGRSNLPCMVSYCASKHAVLSFCDGLRLEVHRFGIKVITIEPFFYETPITNEESILRYHRTAWNECSPEIKELLPSNYFDLFKKCVIKNLKWSTSDNQEKAVDCIEEAISAKDPKYSYSPGTFLWRFSMWFLKRLPKQWVDTIIHYKIFSSMVER